MDLENVRFVPTWRQWNMQSAYTDFAQSGPTAVKKSDLFLLSGIKKQA
jgi:hypothetical protein